MNECVSLFVVGLKPTYRVITEGTLALGAIRIVVEISLGYFTLSFISYCWFMALSFPSFIVSLKYEEKEALNK